MIESPVRILARLASLSRLAKQSTMALPQVKLNGQSGQDTGVHYMKDVPKNPFWLFKKWHTENQTDNSISSNALCLSTASKEGKVSSRSLILRRLDEDGFVIMTDSRSKKAKELDENPSASMAFLWVTTQDGLPLSRQVRIEGEMKKLPTETWTEIYEKEPLFCKIRAYICHQGQKVDWDTLKENHDYYLKKFEEGQLTLDKPDHVVAYKMHPNMIEFYETHGQRIADRIMYLKEEEGDWESSRIAA